METEYYTIVNAIKSVCLRFSICEHIKGEGGQSVEERERQIENLIENTIIFWQIISNDNWFSSYYDWHDIQLYAYEQVLDRDLILKFILHFIYLGLNGHPFDLWKHYFPALFFIKTRIITQFC